MRGAPRLLGSSPGRRMQFWRIAANGAGRSEPLPAERAGGRRAPCVFGYREETELSLRLCARRGRRVRATGIGELVSVLSGPCGEAELVALEPLPPGEATAPNGLLCADRQLFLGFLLREVSGRQGDACSCNPCGPR